MTLNQLVLGILVYWIVAFTFWLSRTRLAGRREMERAMSEAMQKRTGRDAFTVEVQGSINVGVLALAAFAPPLIAVATWILAR
jgi:hypothetical protein